ncbi:FAD-binding and (Fe-S)-binding domain-containing protein [Photobacterium halotolerans]|uniref:D-2-hydroxyglutarate dehydrogenase n=1 Tax=Photobacterium halotolerans TaxID=265726 RepID=A0A7X4WMH6_9GAMM|nr:FAD-binding and (Fe-S)-binding domain-containing protein [Photobacterium halotolerans]NAW64860.1 FAD-binding protein [Photobacterium halotolerans]NAW85432.1 FAD-binding protein [Photobacterium halotolerans]
MLPALTFENSIDDIVLSYLDALENAGFSGDVERTYASRLAVATDNSIYQQLPQAVVFPKSVDDLVLVGKVGQQPAFQQVSFSPRGGGTGTNGQSLTPGIVVDLSRHMNQILEINPQEGWVRVQTGVVKDQLNDALRPHGYFFSPDLSTSNRATIGGMVNTDASGQGSLQYGKTSDHVLALKAVLVDGSVLDTEPLTQDGLARIAQQQGQVAEAVGVAAKVCREKRQQILDKFPPLNRFLTGYDLKNVFNDALTHFDPARLLCGAEGSLAFIAEAKLNITPIPKARALVNIKYDSFDAALRNAPVMVEAQALSVETVDSKVLNLARQDIVWHTVSDLITDVPGKDMQGINIVEFAGNDVELIKQQVQQLSERLENLIGQQGIIGFQVCDDLDSINKIYNMRKKAVGLLGAAKGWQKPIPFAEDTCVPPENLADFIVEFRQLLDEKQLHYGMFGHVDAGVLHVRPALDMCDPAQEKMMKEISDQVVALVAKYGGLMWGEHGKGYRSEYGPEFFGEELFTELRRIKAAFDPHNRLNPGKICTPLDSDAELVKVDGLKRGYFDRQIPVKVRDSFKQAMECNGNGLCFNYDTSSPMCPSMKVSADRRHSPKGRAGLVREWLRLLADQGIDPVRLEQDLMEKSPTVKQIIDRFRNTFGPQRKAYDYSHEVMEAMNGCLACKACASQCPIKVDVPSFRSRFINMYYSRYQRPAKDYLVGYVESYLPVMAKAPSLVNAVMRPGWSKSLTAKVLGYVDMPELSVPTLMQGLAGSHATRFDLQWLQALSQEERQQYVLIVQDPFTSYYDAEVVRDFVHLIEKLGKKPMLVPFKPNGKAQHVKGFLRQFAKTAKNTADFLNQLDELGMPMVGVDPALVLCYRDEYNEMLGDKRGDFKVLTAHEWLMPLLSEIAALEPRTDSEWYLFAHCTEKTKMPNAEKEWAAIFRHFGASMKAVSVGCCGMAGTFGHEKDKLETSKGVFNLSWQPNLAQLDGDRCMATGYSCRSQVKRFEHIKMKHPVQVLLRLVSTA